MSHILRLPITKHFHSSSYFPPHQFHKSQTTTTTTLPSSTINEVHRPLLHHHIPPTLPPTLLPPPLQTPPSHHFPPPPIIPTTLHHPPPPHLHHSHQTHPQTHHRIHHPNHHPTEPKKLQLQGAKILPLTLSISIGLLLRFLIPKPADVTPHAWQLHSIFLSTIAGLVLSPLPVGAWTFIGLTTTIVITKTLTFATVFSAFTNEVIWLIVISFFFARGFVKTGLGDRIATYFVKWLGKSTLGLSYGLALSETLIAPAMPSTTARAGGVFLPIIKLLAVSSGSKPNDLSSRKLGSYLVQSQF